MKFSKKNIIVLISSLMIINTSFADESEFIEETKDVVVEVQLDKQAIMKRAEACIIQNVKNDSVMLVGTSSGTSGLFGIGKRNESTNTIPQGDVIKYKDVDSGTIYANNRIDLKADFVEFSIQTYINFLAKDNKFKIWHNNIVYLQKDVGYGTPDSYKKLPRKAHWGSSLQADAISAISAVTQKIVTCVQSTPNDNW